MLVFSYIEEMYWFPYQAKWELYQMGALPYKTNGNFIKTGALPAKRNFTSCVMRRSSLFVIKEHDYLKKLNFYYIDLKYIRDLSNADDKYKRIDFIG